MGASGVSNSTFISTALAQVENNKVHLWVLIPKQGVAKSTAIAPSGIEDVMANNSAEIVLKNGNIYVEGAQATNITLVAMTGAVVAQADELIDATTINPGIYVAVATLADGSRITTKLAIR